IHQVNGPALLVALAPLHGSSGEIDREVARHVCELQEEVLHHLGLVAERHYEFLEPVGGVEFHDVPEYRVLADADHWLGGVYRFFAEPGTEPAGQDDYFHRIPAPSDTRSLDARSSGSIHPAKGQRTPAGESGTAVPCGE